MKRSALLLVSVITLAVSPSVMADGRKPGSVLVYPVHRSGMFGPNGTTPFFTMVTISNTNLGAETGVHYEYVNVDTSVGNVPPYLPATCGISNRHELLSPGDTLTVNTQCHNSGVGADKNGYLVISAAVDETARAVKWKFDHLVGSEIVVGANSGMYSLNAIPFLAGKALAEFDLTDLDTDMQLDFNDGNGNEGEYEMMPDELYIDGFMGLGGGGLALMNFTGGTAFEAFVQVDTFNDDEVSVGILISFRCWFDAPLGEVHEAFRGSFLAANTLNSDQEVNFNCDASKNDFEAGWARLTSTVANSTGGQSIPLPRILGALTAANQGGLIKIGRPLWRSAAVSGFGDFSKSDTFDAEFVAGEK